jgi:hypothetical protein
MLTPTPKYNEVIGIHDVSRLREGVDPDSIWYTDAELKHVLQVCSGMVDRAVVKCFLGIIQKAHDKKDGPSVVWARTMLNRFESGFIQI